MKLSRRNTFLSVILGLTLIFSTAGMVSANRQTDIRSLGHSVSPGYIGPASDQILVKFKDGVSSGEQGKAKKAVGVNRTVKRIGPAGDKDIYVYEVKPGVSPKKAVDELNRNGDVQAAQVNYRRRLDFTPNDTKFTDQWGFLNTGPDGGLPGADIDAQGAWDFEQGYSLAVTVAVLDTGIDLTHPDLAGKLWINEDEIPNNYVDDDNNGYVDDINGYNFAGISVAGYNWLQPFGGMDYQIAQSIIGTGRPLTSVGLALTKVGSPNYGIIIGVRDNLNGPNLATAVINPQEVPASVFGDIPEINKSLSAQVKLTADMTYYITLETTATDSSNYYQVADIEGPAGYDYYKDGMEHWKIGNSWLDMPRYDLTFRTNDNAVPRDDYGHGTHVSGIIGAETNNALGIAGTSPGAKIMSLKASGAEGIFYSDDIIEAIHYAADNGAKVINMSIGGPGYGALEQMAVYYAAGKGVTLVAAAGNDGKPIVNYPAGYDDVIGVGATQNWFDFDHYFLIDYWASYTLPTGFWAPFSNFNTNVDFSAPGVDILSTMPTYPVALTSYFNQDYDYLSGTSMATPFVSGLASLIIAREPDANAVQVEKVLDRGAEDLGYPGYDPWFGHGVINAYRSLMYYLLNTRPALNPPAPDGDNNWYTTTPTIALEIDSAGATSYYSWDSVVSPTTYTVPFQPASEGAHKLYYFSTLAGATEETRVKTIKVDTQLPDDPTTVVSGSHTTGTVSPDRTVYVSIGGAADLVSGVEGYSVSWTKSASGTPAQALTALSTQTNFTSPALSDGLWWFNLRTKDRAGNWTSTVHLGPFVIDGAPTTARVISPSAPNGDNGWYKSIPEVTLTPDEAAAVYYQLDSVSPGGWIGDPVPDAFVKVAVADGEHLLYYFSADAANNTETVKNAPFMKVDTVLPTGAISINSGDAKTNTPAVILTLSANDGGSGPARMRFKNDSGYWSVWEAYATSVPWTLTGGDGDKTVYAQFKDTAGNISATVLDGIALKTDDVAPAAKIFSPVISTNVSKKKTFPVRWSAADPQPSSGVAAYDVQYKVGSGGSWTSWKTGVTGTSATFAGLPGKTYYFRARAKDNSGNKGDWSAISKTIVPYDQNSLISARAGFAYALTKAGSKFFLGTLRYSAHGGDTITYGVNGKSAALIATKGPNRSKAEIHVDGKLVKTIDNFASTTKYRKKVFSISWPSSGKHKIKITNKGTPGRALFDIDAVAVER